jgi:hypothetical protein
MGMLMLGQAINSIKAGAAGLTQVNNVKPEPQKKLSQPKPEHSADLHSIKPEHSTELLKRQSSAVLPPDFFDDNETKKLKIGNNLYLSFIFIIMIMTIIRYLECIELNLKYV